MTDKVWYRDIPKRNPLKLTPGGDFNDWMKLKGVKDTNGKLIIDVIIEEPDTVWLFYQSKEKCNDTLYSYGRK